MSKRHARFGPSTLEALTKCLRFKYSDINADAAAEGTELHAASETGDLTGLDEEQRLSVTMALDFVESLKQGRPEDWHHLKECRLMLEDLTFGTADVVLVHKTEPIAHVIDLKYTRIEGEHELQLCAYGAGLVEACTQGRDILDHDGNVLVTKSKLRQLVTISTHIVAPRTYVIDTHDYSAPKLLNDTRAKIEDLYAKIDDPFLPPTPHESLCSKCARAARCPELNRIAVVAARGIGLPVPETFNAGAMVSVTDRAKAQVIAGALYNWAKAVKKANNEYVKGGGEIPGFTLRTRSTGIRLPKEFTSSGIAILTNAKYDEDVVMEACSLALGGLAKAQASRTGTPEAEVKESLRTLLSEFVTESSTSFLVKGKRISDQTMMKTLNTGL